MCVWQCGDAVCEHAGTLLTAAAAVLLVDMYPFHIRMLRRLHKLVCLLFCCTGQRRACQGFCGQRCPDDHHDARVCVQVLPHTATGQALCWHGCGRGQQQDPGTHPPGTPQGACLFVRGVVR
jgi:hypothetical protein